ncbi:MAG TPA: aspartate/glutamate racemase family protein [Acidimicrobiales bacterium]|nr:aspartate/glutamate racemase family protein [Acidimicrobiales bacterium]
MRRIGLLGGTSWESTVDYYRLLNAGTRDRLGGSHSADLLLRSADFADIESLQAVDDWTSLGRRYAREAATLVDAGAEVLGICANTMHLLYEDVATAGAPVVHLVDAVAEVAEAAGYTSVGLLGTRYTMASQELYPERFGARGIDVVVPEAEDAAEVHRIIYAELVRGEVLESSRDALVGVVGHLVDSGVQAVILGCTELGMILSPEQSPVPLLDSLAIHVEALLDAALGPSVPASDDPSDGPSVPSDRSSQPALEEGAA